MQSVTPHHPNIGPKAHLSYVCHMIHHSMREAGRRSHHQYGVGPNGTCHRCAGQAVVSAHRQADQADAEVLCARGEGGRGQGWGQVCKGGKAWAQGGLPRCCIVTPHAHAVQAAPSDTLVVSKPSTGPHLPP